MIDDTIFPFLKSFDFESDEDSVEKPLFTDVKWDCENNCAVIGDDGSPVIVTGREALIGWIDRTLKTIRYLEPFYTDEYGCEAHRLVGMPWQRETILAEAKRLVTDCLETNEYIESVEIKDLKFTGSKLSIECAVESIYGTISVEEQNGSI